MARIACDLLSTIVDPKHESVEKRLEGVILDTHPLFSHPSPQSDRLSTNTPSHSHSPEACWQRSNRSNQSNTSRFSSLPKLGVISSLQRTNQPIPFNAGYKEGDIRTEMQQIYELLTSLVPDHFAQENKTLSHPPKGKERRKTSASKNEEGERTGTSMDSAILDKAKTLTTPLFVCVDENLADHESLPVSLHSDDKTTRCGLMRQHSIAEVHWILFLTRSSREVIALSLIEHEDEAECMKQLPDSIKPLFHSMSITPSHFTSSTTRRILSPRLLGRHCSLFVLHFCRLAHCMLCLIDRHSLTNDAVEWCRAMELRSHLINCQRSALQTTFREAFSLPECDEKEILDFTLT
ncbi:hypothetical protein BLNAU_9973 [Blattamonas nauphoetae]|uniref:Uncharacterized protein n=1 Tax=Blattamonas nauphoetae TaxID=2049346 RepID=A0ABQ9XU83_9EUKA|nr:hypothetical protein BLNAU_9973 [Blattamonas nauphoetae]